eukprot:TRINITY_DN3571_c0_g3_i1.p1 TRINITY_DN3571_c0_g3~~TRINITY_DN3571_c0_g3_i1.p1  ORF type:complete len:765 (-),score=221.09 TRINITY_DN3571_c0_g3_i1:1027-3321(-)
MTDITSLQTSIANNLQATITKTYNNANPWLYLLTSSTKQYLLKSYKIPLENSNSSQGNVMELVSRLSEIHREYDFYRVGSMLSEHIVRPLKIEYALKGSSELCVEILLEYPGEQVSQLNETDVDICFELMRQSAHAMSFGHSVEEACLNIRLDSTFFDKETGTLKVLKGHTRSAAYTMSPEVLKEEIPYESSTAAEVYSWAMSFYSMMLNKTEEELKREVNSYKLRGRESYERFIEGLRRETQGLRGNDLRKSVMVEELVKALSYEPKERPSMTEIRDRLQEVAKNRPSEAEHKQKLLELLALKEKPKSDTVIEANEEEINNLMNVGNSMLKYLKDKKREYEIIKNCQDEIRANYEGLKNLKGMLERMNKEKVSLEYAIDEKSLLFAKIRSRTRLLIEKTQKATIVKFLQELTQFKKEIKEIAKNKRHNRASSRSKPEAKQIAPLNRCVSKGKNEERLPILTSSLTLQPKLPKSVRKDNLKQMIPKLGDVASKDALNKENSKHTEEEKMSVNVVQVKATAEDGGKKEILKEKNKTAEAVGVVEESGKGSLNVQSAGERKESKEVADKNVTEDKEMHGNSKISEEKKDNVKLEDNLSSEKSEVDNTMSSKESIEDKASFLNETQGIESARSSVAVTEKFEEVKSVIVGQSINAEQASNGKDGIVPEDQAESEEEKMPEFKPRKCVDCIDSVYEEAILECDHSVCEDCIVQYICHCFTYFKSYRYFLFCSTCEEMKPISNFSNKRKKLLSSHADANGLHEINLKLQ